MLLFYIISSIGILIYNIDGLFLSVPQDKQCGFQYYNTTHLNTPQAGKYAIVTPQIIPEYTSHLHIKSDFDYCWSMCSQSVLINGTKCWAITYIGPDNCYMFYYDQPPTVVYRMSASHTSTSAGVSFYLRVCPSDGVNATFPPHIMPTLPPLTTTGNATLTVGPPLVVNGISYIQQGVNSPVPGKCFHLNTLFNFGEHWTESCRYDCVCHNATTNTKLCTDTCVHFKNIPDRCVLTHDADACCPYLTCINGTTPHSNSSLGCKDEIETCEFYNDDACVGDYQPWALAHCALRCGYCNYTAPCIDRISYCDIYELERECSTYPSWARYNCKRSCSLCS